MLKLGLVSAILAESSFEEVVQFAGTHGFSCLEIMCWPASSTDNRRYAGVTHLDVERLDEQAMLHIQQVLAENKVFVSGLGYYPNPLDPDREKADFYIEHLKKIIRAASKLNIPLVNTFIGRNPALNITENLALFKKYWVPIIKTAEEYNVKIGIENCPMLFTEDEWPGGKNLATTPAIWDKLFEIIPSPIFGLNYDPSHLIWQMMDEVQPIYDYKDRLHHIHLKDAKLYKDKLNRAGIMATPLQYHSPKLPGLGDVRWRDFFSALTTVRYKGAVCIEVEDKAYEGSAADVRVAILTARNYLNQFLG